MKVEVDDCVGCPPNMGCLGSGCPMRHSYYYRCDECEAEYVDCRIDGMDLCDECAEKYLDDIWHMMTVREKAEVLDVDFELLEV